MTYRLTTSFLSSPGRWKVNILNTQWLKLKCPRVKNIHLIEIDIFQSQWCTFLDRERRLVCCHWPLGFRVFEYLLIRPVFSQGWTSVYLTLLLNFQLRLSLLFRMLNILPRSSSCQTRQLEKIWLKGYKKNLQLSISIAAVHYTRGVAEAALIR